uniref:dolichol kinase n=1 Tax=Mycena chlorophos TaxID=658473 RepID=A0ABQ0MDP3_MYCCL|nr:dolichol kinase [Mycena chlorophos]
MDSRRVGESLVLMCSLFSATAQIEQFDTWMAYELYLLLASALAYLAYTNLDANRTTSLASYGCLSPKIIAIRATTAFSLVSFLGRSLRPPYSCALLNPIPATVFPRTGPSSCQYNCPHATRVLRLLWSPYYAAVTTYCPWPHLPAPSFCSTSPLRSGSKTANQPQQVQHRPLTANADLYLEAKVYVDLLEVLRIGIWQHLNLFDVIVGAIFYQFTLYVALRMAHRGLTLGELGLICFGGTAVFMEFLNITIARIWPVTTAFLKTYRLPTPLVVFQTALVAGPFLTGFLIAPLLVLSRHAAQTPMRRQRRLLPSEALRARQRLAAAAAVVALLIIFGPLGLWTRWCLGNRDPWIWAVLWVVSRHRRVALLAYWAALGSVSVAGWTRQLARTRRTLPNPVPVDATASPTSALFAASNELLDRAPTLKLNERRKFFHALVVLMFIPGIAFDPAFTHLAFSAAFAAFVFAEYIRYFAIYPLGAAVHRFMSEFLDTKDSGTAILSHFYLLTGCAGALWLEGPSWLLQYTGVLVLGIGDALASIVGKRHGRHVWSPSTTKTLEGSAAFSASVVVSAWLLRLFGLAEQFSTLRYVFVIALASVLEALSDQNDNLTLPLFTWSVLVVARVT